MRVSLEGKLTLLLLLAMSSGAAVATWIMSALRSGSLALPVLLALLIALVPGVLLAMWLARWAATPVRRLLRAMVGAVASYRDGDFSLSLTVDRRDELGQLTQAHNELGNALREQRHQLVQREMMLDAIAQNSPVALVLVDAHRRVVFSNLAARHLLNNGSSLQGQDFEAILARGPQALREAAMAHQDVLFTVPGEDDDETYHLSSRRLSLGGRAHQLLLIKRLTRELSRQEVVVWKKLIRTLSHELNNSLAPISSLANSGAELARRRDLDALPGVFQTIGERASHLHQFILGYSQFARLPVPRPQRVQWAAFLAQLQQQAVFAMPATLPADAGWFDQPQLEQVLINLLKNAHESGSDSGAVEMTVMQADGMQRIEVRDRGSGMSEAVLTQALLPFYSTKRSGTGLGLALAREITEAHGGQIRLANRDGGGVVVSLALPLPGKV
jgi:two-component system, NtrC family, nitrogen regulation sensor histidine kinase NtrY